MDVYETYRALKVKGHRVVLSGDDALLIEYIMALDRINSFHYPRAPKRTRDVARYSRRGTTASYGRRAFVRNLRASAQRTVENPGIRIVVS